MRRFDRRDFFQKAGTLGIGAVAGAATLRGSGQAASRPPAGAMNPLQAPQNLTWIATTQSSPWHQKDLAPLPGGRGGFGGMGAARDLEVLTDAPAQTMEGFGACFNELGWTSLQLLSDLDRQAILREMFAPGAGANFTLCRMPIAANDFSRDWYSYDETDGDFALAKFSIANDLETLVPFIKNALKYQPALRLWASPWSPPTWMKRNKHYSGRPAGSTGRAGAPGGAPGGQPGRGAVPGAPSGPPAQRPVEGGPDFNLFIDEERYYATYAAYFGRFIDAYRQQGIDIGMVMPQNEFNSAQGFPACTWTPDALARFLRHLGPEMARRKVTIFFGTLERANPQMLETVLADPQAGRYIAGLGAQWAGKGAIAAIHRKHPEMPIYQTEQECGDGRNDWSFFSYAWDLTRHYIRNGANGYLYWNLSLEEGGSSRWGWKQNSLVTVDPSAKTYRYTHEYYAMKHLSRFVQPGARRLETQGTFDNALAFANPDRSIVAVMRNESSVDKAVAIAAAGNRVRVSMEPDSLNTVVLA